MVEIKPNILIITIYVNDCVFQLKDKNFQVGLKMFQLYLFKRYLHYIKVQSGKY